MSSKITVKSMVDMVGHRSGNIAYGTMVTCKCEHLRFLVCLWFVDQKARDGLTQDRKEEIALRATKWCLVPPGLMVVGEVSSECHFTIDLVGKNNQYICAYMHHKPIADRDQIDAFDPFSIN